MCVLHKQLNTLIQSPGWSREGILLREGVRHTLNLFIYLFYTVTDYMMFRT